MSIDALLGWLLESTLAVTAASLLVLAMRRLVRRLFGAGMAYAMWALIPLSMFAVSLPAPIRDIAASTVPAAAPATDRVERATVTAAVSVRPAASPWPRAPSVAAFVWATGAIAVAGLFWRQQRRYVIRLGRLRYDAGGHLRTEAIAACPAVVGAWRPRIVLPADFESRYPAHEGELVLAHERVHLARQDVRLNLIESALRCVYWFNPVLHVAADAYRRDQEFACDATVLARYPHSRRTYADAMLKTQLAVLGLPVGCHWQSSQSLKERITMLKKPLPSRRSVRLGAIAVAGLLMGSSYAGWALQPARALQAAQGPARLGMMLEGPILYADVTFHSGRVPLFVVGGAMESGPSGTPRVYSDREGVLQLGMGESPKAPATLLLIADTVGSDVRWRLERDGKQLDSGSVRLAAGQPAALDIDGSRYGTPASVTVKFMRTEENKFMLFGGSNAPRRLERGADGIYVDRYGGTIVNGKYATPGEAQVLVQVSKDGFVVGARVESSRPAGAFTDKDARAYFADAKYAPPVENGMAVAASIRTRIEFSPGIPEDGIVSAFSGSDAVRDAAERMARASGLVR